MKTLLFSLFAIALLALFSARSNAAEVLPFVTYTHGSDILRGPPFNNEAERTYDFIGGGVTVRFDHFMIDIAQGFKSFDCSVRKHDCATETATELGMRWYFRSHRIGE